MQGKKSYFICWHEHDQIALLSKLTKYGQSKRSWPPSNRQNGITLTLKNVLWIFLFNCTSWTSVRCPIFHQLMNNVFAFYWTREFGYVSLNVLYNLSINILFKTHNDVYLCSHAVIRYAVWYWKLNVTDFQCNDMGKYTSNVNIQHF